MLNFGTRKKNELLLNYVRKKEQKQWAKQHTTYRHVGGLLFLISRILFTVTSVINLMLGAAYLMGIITLYGDYSVNDPESYLLATSVNILFICSLMLIILLMGIILASFKKYIVAGFCALVSTVFLTVSYIQTFGEEGAFIAGGNSDVLFPYMIVFLGLMVLSMIFLLIIYLPDRVREKQLYEDTLEKLYKKYNLTEDVSEEEWEDMIRRLPLV